MKKWIIAFLISASSLLAQTSPQSPASYVAGRFVAYNYGQWSINIYKAPAGTGSQTFIVTNATVTLPDGRKTMPFNTNASIYVGTEVVTPSAVSNCILNDSRPNVCTITATFSRTHTTSDTVRSATFGLQEALNDAGVPGGTAVIDGSWAGIGGTDAIKNAATIPGNSAIEDCRTSCGQGGGGGGVTSVTGTAPVVSSGGATPAISMPAATTSVDGYLPHADWNTFNGKQAALSLLAGTYVNGDWCSYASGGTLLNCNNAAPQAQLNLIKGTYVDGDYCTYTAAGTLLNCNTTPAGAGTVTVVGAGALTSTAFMTGGGSQASQTPSATSTLDSSGNATFAGQVAGTAGIFGTPSAAARAALPTGAPGTACDETSTAGVPATSVDYLRCDATNHGFMVSVNNGAEAFSLANYSQVSTALIAANAVTLAKLATQGANTVLANVTGSTAVPTAAAIPSGVQFYTAGTGYSAATSANLLGVCTTCVTSASSLTSGALMTGAGSQGAQTITTGTGIATALGVNIGSAGAPVLYNGAGGTPSSLVLTNATGLPILRAANFSFGTPGGSAISTGVLGYMSIPNTCTINGWYIAVDAGTATVKTLKVAAGTAIPTLGSNSISTSGVAISTGTVIQSTTVTDFTTTAVTANDIVAADLITTSGVGYIDFQLKMTCTQ